MKKKLFKKLRKHKDAVVEKVAERTGNEEPPKKVPSITNVTIAEHRDEVLSSARKYIYPLQHSKHKIVLISVSVFIAALITFFSYCTLAMYKMQSNSGFLYHVTQVVPFPVARIGNQFVAYENYLFELKRYIHYYESQQKLDFENHELDKTQLDKFKKQALERVINFAYIKRLANENGVSVSNKEVQDEIELLRGQNRLGSSDQTLDDVLADYFGWSKSDFERYLRQELLTQKVVAALDAKTQARADKAYQELKSGKSFAKVAKKYSDDITSKNNGGEFGFTIDKSNRDLTPEATQAIFSLKTGKYSGVVNTGYSLEIFKLTSKKSNKAEASHILFNFKDVSSYINDLKETQPAKAYVKF